MDRWIFTESESVFWTRNCFMPTPILIFVPLFALLGMSFVFRDNFGAKTILYYLGTYLGGFGLLVLFGIPVPLIGAIGGILVIIMFFHAKLRGFM